MLLNRYNRTGNMDDLKAAISGAELVVSATPENYPNHVDRLSNLGTMLSLDIIGRVIS